MKPIYLLKLVFLMTSFVFISSVNATNFTVTNLNNTGTGSLRQAITDANGAGSGPHLIDFSVSGIITITSHLPVVSVPNVTIDGGGNITVSANGGDIARYVFRANAYGDGTTFKNIDIKNTGYEPFRFDGSPTDITIENVNWYHDSGNYLNYGIFFNGNANGLTIKNVVAKNQQNYGEVIRITGSATNVTIDNLTFDNTYSYLHSRYVVLISGAANNVIIKNCNWNLDNGVSSNDSDYGIYFNNSVTDCEITNVEILNCEVYPLYVRLTTNNLKIANFTATNGDGYGGAFGMRFGSTVSNLDMDTISLDLDHTTSTDDGNYGIYFDGVTNNVNIDRLTIHDAEIYGIFFAGAATDITMKRTLIDNFDGWTQFTGIRFNSSANHITMNNVTIDGDLNGTTNDGDEGIWFNSDNTADVSLTNVSVNEFDADGIRFYDIDNLIIDSCSFTNNYDGLEFYNNDARTNVEIKNSTFSGSTTSSGMILNVQNGTTELNIHNNIISNNRYGIRLYAGSGVKDIQITDNEIFDNNYAGIYNERADGVLYSENSIYNNIQGIDNVSNDGNNGLENSANEVPFITSSESIGADNYTVSFILPSFCNSGDCNVEFFTNNSSDLPLNGRNYISTFLSLGAGTHTQTLNSGGNTTGFWTATLKVSSLNNSVSEFSNSQLILPKAPAGVSNGIALWMDASFGVTETGGNDIIEWIDRSGNHTPSFYNSDPNLLLEEEDLVNFNPVAHFDNNDYIRWDGDDFVSGYTSGEIFMLGSEASPATTDHSHLFDFGGGSNAHYTYSNQYIYEDFGSSDRKRWLPSNTAVNGGEGISGVGITGPNRKTTDFHIYNVLSETNNWQAAFDGITAVTDVSNTVNFTTPSWPHLGARYGGVSNGGRLPELVLYSRVLDTDERQRVNSYLAIRYGIELGHNYYASDWDGSTGTTFWTLGAGYDNDIAGIARDDNGSLLQKQSKSINSDAIVAMYYGIVVEDLPNSNDANSFSPTLDKSAILWGNNNLGKGLSEAYIPTSFTPPPSAPFYHMSRVWNVEETGTIGTVTISVPEYLNLDYMLVHNSDDFGVGTPDEVKLKNNGDGFLIATYNFSNGEYFTFGAMRGAPGCVTANLDLWLKANAGVYSHNDTLTWLDQSGVEKHFNQATLANQALWLNGEEKMNYNSTLDFDGSNDFFNQPNTWANDDDATIYVVALSNNNSGWRSLYDVDNDDFTLFNRNSPQDVGFWNYGSSPAQAGNSNILPLINTSHIYGGSWINANTNSVSIISNGDKQATTMEMTNTISTSGVVSLGSGANRYWWDGLISEVIVYKRELTPIEHEKVESYLAIKYGITLDQTIASTNYIDGGANVIWTAGNNYDNDIAGIARDDCQALYQKQSQSVNEDALVSIYNGEHLFGLPVSNSANTEPIFNDKNFMLWGNNDSTTSYSLLYSPNTFTPPPPSAFFLMKRKWKIEENGSIGLVTIAIPTSTRADYMLVHNSDDFNSGTPIEVALIDDGNGSLVASCNFNNGDYFTFGANTKAPGCVANDLRLWLDANYGYGTILNGVTWEDQTFNNFDVSQTVNSREANYVTSSDIIHNFHPHMSFDGGDVFETDEQVLQSATSSGSVFFVAKYDDFAGYDSPVDFSADDPHIGRYSNNPLIANNGSSPFLHRANSLSLIASQNQISGFEWTGGTNGGVEIRLDGEFEVNTTMDFVSIAYTSNLGIGGYISGAEGINGSMNEVIIYDRNLTPTETQKVESYLAVKYGITLAHDYLCGNGSLLWDSSGMSTYHNNIGAIGRDDCAGLNQKQSKSVNNGSIPTIYLGDQMSELPTGNSENSSNFTSNKSFLFWGSNDSSTIYSEEYPSNSYIKYMKRNWNVKEINSIGTVTIYASDPNALVLIIDSDGDFSDGNSTLIPLSNQMATYNFSDGDYFTFANLECKEVTTLACPSSTALDLTSYVPNYTIGGTWSETTISGANISNPTSVDFSSTALGTYSFKYIGLNYSCDIVTVERLTSLPTPAISDILVCEGGSTEIIIPAPEDRIEVLYNEPFNGSNGNFILRSKCTGSTTSTCYTDDAIDLANRGLYLDSGTDFNQWNRWWHTWVYDVHNLRFGRLRDQEVSISTTSYILLPGETAMISGQSRRYWGRLETGDYVKFLIDVDGVETEFANREGHISAGFSTSSTTYKNTTALPQNIKLRVKIKNSWGEGHIIDNLKISKLLAPPVYNFYSDASLTDHLASGLQYDPLTPAGESDTVYVTISENGCESLGDQVIVEVSPNDVEPMEGESVFFCSGTPVDFTAAIGNFQAGGTWYDDDATGITIGTGTNVNISSLPDGSYNFTYQLNGTAPCLGEEAVITVNIGLNPEPPIIDDIDVCSGGSTTIYVTPDEEIEQTLYDQKFVGSNGGYILLGRCTDSTSASCRRGDDYKMANRGLYLDPGTDFSKWNRWATWVYDVHNLRFGRMMDEEISMSTDTFNLLPGELATFSGQSRRYFGVLEASDYVKFFYVIDGVETEFDSREGQISTSWALSQGVYENLTLSPQNIQLRIKVKNSWGEGHIIDNLKITKALNKPIYTFYSDGNLTTQIGTGYSYDPATTAGNTDIVYVTSTYNGCESVADTVQVTVNNNDVAPMTGGEVFYCSGSGTIDLTSFITPFQLGGTWTDQDDSGIDFEDPTNVDVSAIADGSYSLLYSVLGSCDEEVVEVMIHIGLIGSIPFVVPDGTVSDVLSECKEDDWIYFIDPNDDSQRVLAINTNGNSIDPSAFQVKIDIDAPDTDLERTLGSGSFGKAVRLMRRQIQINCPTCNLLSPAVDVRIYWNSIEKTNAGTAMDELMDDHSITGTKYWEWFKVPLDIVDIPANLSPNGILSGGLAWEEPDSVGLEVNGVQFVQFNDINSFSSFGGGWSVNQPNISLLPIEMIEFKAKAIDNQFIELKWITASESNNKGFSIEKSFDAINFDSIGWVDGNGTSSNPSYYQFKDYDVENDVYYYRLKQQDFDGSTSYSKIQNAEITGINSLEINAKLIPNPSRGLGKISIKNHNEVMPITIQIIDNIGNIILSEEHQLELNTNVFEFDYISNSEISKGVYHVVITNKNGVSQVLKWIIL